MTAASRENGSFPLDLVMIDIDRLNEAELIDLNHRVVARLKFLQQMRAHAQMLDFSIGERVSFQPPGRGLLTGTIVKYNQKTVTLITDPGQQQWNVAPMWLRKLAAPASAPPAQAPVAPLASLPDKPS